MVDWNKDVKLSDLFARGKANEDSPEAPDAPAPEPVLVPTQPRPAPAPGVHQPVPGEPGGLFHAAAAARARWRD